MNRPVHRSPSAYSADDDSGSLLHRPSQRLPHELTPAPPPPRPKEPHRPASRPDLAAAQALRLGNPVAPSRGVSAGRQPPATPTEAVDHQPHHSQSVLKPTPVPLR